MHKHHILQITLFLIYIISVTALMVWKGIGIDPSRYIFILFIPAFFLHKTRRFLMDWIPFIFLLLSYDFLRGLAPLVNNRVHYLELIQADKLLFGILPSVSLQQYFYNPGNLQWYDFAATIIYFLHFALPLSFGFLVWMINKREFKRFVTAILFMSYAGWLTYVIYPAAPPWLAAQEGMISGVSKIMNETLQYFPTRLNLPSIYHNFNPNIVAAIPSMHAAYTSLVLFFSLSLFGKKGLLFLLYFFVVTFSIVYLGEHYMIDAIIGFAYACIFFAISKFLFKYQQALEKRMDKILRFFKINSTQELH